MRLLLLMRCLLPPCLPLLVLPALLLLLQPQPRLLPHTRASHSCQLALRLLRLRLLCQRPRLACTQNGPFDAPYCEGNALLGSEDGGACMCRGMASVMSELTAACKPSSHAIIRAWACRQLMMQPMGKERAVFSTPRCAPQGRQ